MAADEALIDLRGVGRFYRGAGGVHALRDVSLTIRSGEFVCIMGPSGSGKSTLMNIVGCLDTASSGQYLFRGRATEGADADQLARLRRNAFGFVFQTYNLLGSATAEENVEMPAVYAGVGRAERLRRARLLLRSLGLGHRLRHRPAALSGGEQQRVAIARALMNGGEVLLADEPTGALDTANGIEVLTTLRDLAENGHTVVVITHDPEVAQWASRRIDLLDGAVVGDTGPAPDDSAALRTPSANAARGQETAPIAPPGFAPADGTAAWRTRLAAAGEALRNGTRSLAANLLRTARLRSALTVLSVAVGVWAVVAVLSVVQGGYQAGVELAAQVASTMTVQAGLPRERADVPPARLTLADARAIEGLPNVRSARVEASPRKTIQYGHRSIDAQVCATTTGKCSASGDKLAEGAAIAPADGERLAAVAVLGARVRRRLFTDALPVLGEHVLIDGVPFEVKGVMEWEGPRESRIVHFGDLTVRVPYQTALALLGVQNASIYVELEDPLFRWQAHHDVHDLLTRRHGNTGFWVHPAFEARHAFGAIEKLLSTVIATVGTVSFVLGGLGVTSVMLLAVTERRREIGIRMATGARRRDIAQQFLLEASAVTGAGGLLGTVLGVATAPALEAISLPVAFAPWFLAAALVCAIGTGLVAGLVPARRAAMLDPVQALAR